MANLNKHSFLHLEMARAFSLRLNCHISSSALQAWHQVYATHRNSLSFACQYYSTQLRYKMLLEWRIHLRAKLKMIKQARLAEKFFVIRKAWRAWTERFEEKTREKKLKALELQRLKKRFGGMTLWHNCLNQMLTSFYSMAATQPA